jgi:hypothetical protein
MQFYNIAILFFVVIVSLVVQIKFFAPSREITPR